jgi:predicted MFS family arabinose efflux permease
LALLLMKSLVPESRDPEASPLDPVGAGLSIAGLASLLWAIIEAPSAGWSSTGTMAAFGLSGVLLAAFVAWELRTPHPMLDVRLFRNGRFSGASAAISLTFFGLFGTIFFLTTHLQDVLGYTPLEAGYRVIPVALGMIVASGLSARLTGRLGTKRMVAGGLAVVSFGLLLLSTVSVGSGYGLVGAVLLIMGLGMGLAMAPATDSVMGSLPLAKASVGSAMNDTTRMVGGSLGVAVLGSLLSSGYRSEVASATSSLPAPQAEAANDTLTGALGVAGQIGGETGRMLADASQAAFVSGMGTAALVAAAVTLAGSVAALVLLPSREPEAAVAELPAAEAEPEALAA